ncbi:MAG: HAD hydrolase-like protein [Pseudomonadota bacterium]
MTTLPVTRPDAILFDLDGTLIDSFQWLLNLHNRVRIRMGEAAWDAETFIYYMHSSSRVLYPRLFGDRAPQALTILNEELARQDYDGMAVALGCNELLRGLQQAGMPMGLVSNKTHAGLVNDVAHYGWGDIFLSVVGAGRATRDKPAADPALMALAEMQIDPPVARNIWYIGDTITDVQMAENAGLFMIVIGHRVDAPADGLQYDSLPDLHNALRHTLWWTD